MVTLRLILIVKRYGVKMKFTDKEVKKKLVKDHNFSKDWLDKHLTVINVSSSDITNIFKKAKVKK